jgi:hypothetical protein
MEALFMQKKIFLLAVLSILLVFNPAFSADKDSFQIKKQPEIQQVKPKKPVKIKLKRSTEGKYSWELSGDDTDEVVRADKRLRKLLKIE